MRIVRLHSSGKIVASTFILAAFCSFVTYIANITILIRIFQELAFASKATLLANISSKLWVEGSGKGKFWERVGLHHSQVAPIDQRKSLPFLYLNLWGCILRANILFSQSFAHIYGSSQSYWCSPRILDAVKIYGFLDLLQKNIFSSPRHHISHAQYFWAGLGNRPTHIMCATIMLHWLVLTPLA